jgi:MerR family mercuric resistance operon transcriptional regulator
MPDELRIGELATAVGVSRDTIRYYEKLNLLSRPSRSRAGYRLYSSADIERLRFIKQAQGLGFSLEEVKGLLSAGRAGLSECRQVRGLLSSKIRELDERLAEIKAFRRTLASYLKECEETLASKDKDHCPVLVEITNPNPRKGRHEPIQNGQSGRALRNRKGVQE